MTRTLAAALLAVAAVTVATCSSDDPPATGASPAATDVHGSGGANGTAPPTDPIVIGERVRLLVSGSLEGRLEPCGCAAGQLGGLARRMAHVLEPGRNYDLLIEGGDLVKGNTLLDVEKALTAAEALFLLPQRSYDALGVGPADLALPAGEWYGVLAGMQVPLVASDLQSTAGEWPGRAFVERDVRGTKVRIASLTMRLPTRAGTANGDGEGGGAADGLQLLEPAAGWQRALQGAADETLRVLLVHDAPERARSLAKSLQPRPDLVVGVDDTHHEPPPAAETVAGVPIVFPGIRGRILLDLVLARTSDGPRLLQYETVPLRGSDSKPGAGQDPDVRAMLLTHRNVVKDREILAKMAGTLPAPPGGGYVGSAACKECHPQDYETWSASKHAHAWETLVRAEQDPQRYGWPVTFYPDCVSCHVVGFREQGGFVTAAATPHLTAVGCERCHGAGGDHSKAPKQHPMGKVNGGLPSLLCVQCHDFEQTPDFDYTQRWAQIVHGKPAATKTAK